MDKHILLPRDNSYAEALRYMVQTCEPDYLHLPFLVGLWNQALRKGLTERQIKWLDPHYRLTFGQGIETIHISIEELRG